MALGISGGVLFYLMREHETKTGPALVLVPSYDADISTVQNITQAVTALTPKPVD